MTTTPQAHSHDDFPETRGELARARAKELHQRQADLADGIPATAATAARAHRRAEEALERAESAHHAAAERHLEAGQAHRRAAAAHEEAALLAGNGSGDAHQDAAQQHRNEAEWHDAAAAEQSAAEELDKRRRS
jgi:hypothetical protein